MRTRRRAKNNIKAVLPKSAYCTYSLPYHCYIVKDINISGAQQFHYTWPPSQSNMMPWVSIPLFKVNDPHWRFLDQKFSSGHVGIRGIEGTLGSGDMWTSLQNIYTGPGVGWDGQVGAKFSNAITFDGVNSAPMMTQRQPDGWDRAQHYYSRYRVLKTWGKLTFRTLTWGETLLIGNKLSTALFPLTSGGTDAIRYADLMQTTPVYLISRIGPYSCDAGINNYDQSVPDNVHSMYGDRTGASATARDQVLDSWSECIKHKGNKLRYLRQGNDREAGKTLRFTFKPRKILRMKDSGTLETSAAGTGPHTHTVPFEIRQSPVNNTNQPFSGEQADYDRALDNHVTQEGWGWLSFTFGATTEYHHHQTRTSHDGNQLAHSQMVILRLDGYQKWRVKLSAVRQEMDNFQYANDISAGH